MDKEKFPIDEIHQFWFGECTTRPETLTEQARLWFSANEAADLYIKTTFERLFEPLLRVKASSFKSSKAILCAIIVLDQFSRSAFRSTPKAFKFDRQALTLTDFVLEKGWDINLEPIERAFLLMPLQHSESLRRQKLSTAMFEDLLTDSQEPYREYLVGMHKYACMHREIIERFGRFPHRNIILGRANGEEEEAYLRTEKQRFGQPGSRSNN